MWPCRYCSIVLSHDLALVHHQLKHSQISPGRLIKVGRPCMYLVRRYNVNSIHNDHNDDGLSASTVLLHELLWMGYLWFVIELDRYRFGRSLDRQIPDLCVNVIDHYYLHFKLFIKYIFVQVLCFFFACELLVLDKIFIYKTKIYKTAVVAACISRRYKQRQEEVSHKQETFSGVFKHPTIY